MRRKLFDLARKHSVRGSVLKRVRVSSFSRKKVIGDDKAFYVKLNEDRVIGVAHSIKELKAVLKTADPNVFSFHVGKDRNDFSAWIKSVFKDSILVKKIDDCKNLEEVIKVL